MFALTFKAPSPEADRTFASFHCANAFTGVRCGAAITSDACVTTWSCLYRFGRGPNELKKHITKSDVEKVIPYLHFSPFLQEFLMKKLQWGWKSVTFHNTELACLSLLFVPHIHPPAHVELEWFTIVALDIDSSASTPSSR